MNNGDAVLIEAHGKTILTDINYCEADEENKLPDLGGALWEACPDSRLHVFASSHPDVDHVRGFDKVFHIGGPDKHNARERILVEEIWCSPYGAEPNYVTDEAKPMIDEIKRRKALLGTAAGAIAGNRLVIRDTSGEVSGQVCDGISWELLAPTAEEADIPEGEDEDRPSSNPSSLVIRWSIRVDGRENLVLVGGDTNASVMQRVWQDNNESTPGRLTWEILVSPHHNSRYALGCKDEEGTFEFWDDAVNALSQKSGDGWVVASSRPIKDDDVDPPSFAAKEKYLEILAAGREVTDSVESRFLCTGEHNEGKPAHVVFDFTSSGPAEKRSGSRSASILTSSVSRGGGYG